MSDNESTLEGKAELLILRRFVALLLFAKENWVPERKAFLESVIFGIFLFGSKRRESKSATRKHYGWLCYAGFRSAFERCRWCGYNWPLVHGRTGRRLRSAAILRVL